MLFLALELLDSRPSSEKTTPYIMTLRYIALFSFLIYGLYGQAQQREYAYLNSAQIVEDSMSFDEYISLHGLSIQSYSPLKHSGIDGFKSISLSSTLEELELRPSSKNQIYADPVSGLIAVVQSYKDLERNYFQYQNRVRSIGKSIVLPIEVSLGSEPESENGFIDICQGESVTFTANVDYQGGSGTDESSTFEWTIIGVTNNSGMGEIFSEFSYTFNEPNGYQVKVFVTDENGAVNSDNVIVRVSTTPDFSGVVSAFRDTICLGDTTRLIGTVTDDLLSLGVSATTGSIETGGSFSDTLELPDGGAAVTENPEYYNTPIEFCNFEPGAVLSNVEDLDSICLTIEHSWVSDLEIWMTCPDGTDVLLVDAYAASGAGTGLYFQNVDPLLSGNYFGEPDEGDGTGPGIGYEYCFAPSSPLGDFQDAMDAGVLLNDNTIVPGTYEPQGDFQDFVGCPLNGTWTLWVGDYWSIDDGWVFNWNINFSEEIIPDTSGLSYTPILQTSEWIGADIDPSVIFSNDTLLDVSPAETGSWNYTFQVSDNFGCTYDTTIVLEVLPPVSATVFPPACNLSVDYEVVNQYAGGTWTYTSDYDSLFVIGVGGSDIDVSAPGFYTLSYFDNFCQTTIEADVEFLPFPIADILPDTTELCSGQEEFLTTAEQINGLQVNYQWTYDSLGTQFFLGSEATQAVYFGGDYSLLISDPICGNIAIDDSYVLEEPCIIETYNIFTPNGDGQNDFFYIQAIDKFVNPVVYVYNRWGNVVFEKRNYRNDWDMADLSEGTYYYVILNPANSESFKGSFTLLR
jgi:gliding motility-associated-like protein